MIKLITFGSPKSKEMAALISDYEKRINKYHHIEVIELKEHTHKTKEENLKLEANDIKRHLLKNCYVIVNDIEGEKINSVDLSEKINSLLNHYPNIMFIIGSSNGIDNEIKKQANMLLSFSDLTFPHLIFRLMFLEQIYRSFKILNNESYHK